MTDKASEEKRSLLRAYSAEVVICPSSVTHESPDYYKNVAYRLAKEIPGACCPDQYSNPANPDAHYATTGPEIWSDTAGRITAFVSGIGTAGTITGTARYLKEKIQISRSLVQIRQVRSTQVIHLNRTRSKVLAWTYFPKSMTHRWSTK